MDAVLVLKAWPIRKERMWRGLPIAVEHPVGSIRRGVDDGGNPWATKMTCDYGYVHATEGMDGEDVDVFVADDESAPRVYCIMTKRPPDFTRDDEQKCMLGFQSADAAKQCFLAHYDDHRFFGGMTVMPFEEFERKVLNTPNGSTVVKSLRALVWAGLRGRSYGA